MDIRCSILYRFPAGYSVVTPYPNLDGRIGLPRLPHAVDGPLQPQDLAAVDSAVPGIYVDAWFKPRGANLRRPADPAVVSGYWAAPLMDHAEKRRPRDGAWAAFC